MKSTMICIVVIVIVCSIGNGVFAAEKRIASFEEVFQNQGLCLDHPDMLLKIGLDILVRDAVLHHPSVTAKQLELTSAQASVESAKWGFFPTPSITREQVSAKKNDPTYGAGTNQQTTLALNQSIWTWGRLTATKDHAEALAQANVIAISEQREMLADQVFTSFAEWMRAYKQLALTEKYIDIHQQLYEQSERRIASGVTAQIDRELTLGRLRQLQVDRARLKASRSSALHRLSQLVGHTLNEETMADFPESVLCVPGANEYLDSAASRNLTLARLNSNIKAQDADIESRKAARFPEIYARMERDYGAYGSSGNTPYNRVFIGFNYQTGAGLSINSDIAALVAHRDATVDDIHASKLVLLDQLNSEWLNYQTLNEQRKATEQSLSNAIAVKESYERQYQAGRKSWLDVMNMVREQLQLELQMAEIDSSLITQSRSLYLHASGIANWGIE